MASGDNEGNGKILDSSSESLVECQESCQPAIAFAKEPADRSMALAGYMCWLDLAVNNKNGTALYLDKLSPLRARRVEFFVDNLAWRNGPNSPLITDPMGNGRPAGGGFFGIARPEYGVVIFQERGLRWCATVDKGINQRDLFWPEGNICFNVNDKEDRYRNNSGSFSIWLRVLG